MAGYTFKLDAILAKYGVMDLPFGSQLRKDLANEWHNAKANAAEDILEFCRENQNAYCLEVVRHFGKRHG